MVPKLPSGPIWLHWKSGLVVRCSVAFKLFLTRTCRRTSSSVELTLAWWQKGWRDISQFWTKENSTYFRHKNNKPQLRRFLWQKLWEKNMRRNEIHCCAMFLCFTLVAQRTICPLSSFTSAAYLSVSIFWTFNIALMGIILCYISQIWYVHWAAYFVAEKCSENVNWTFYWWNVICTSSKRNDRKTKGGVIRVFVLFLVPATWQSSLVSQTSFLSCAPPLDQT